MAQVPPVDPTHQPRLLERFTRTFGQTKVGTWIGREILAPIEPKVIKATRGKVVLVFGMPTLNMTTFGRKSGEPRTVTLQYFTRGEDVVLIASSFGRDKHPAWYLNLGANPHAELFSHGKGEPYVAREAEPKERDELFTLAVELYGGYAKYQEGTERRIPVMVLSPAGEG